MDKARKTKKRSHKNDRRRLTAGERVAALVNGTPGNVALLSVAHALVRMLEAHAAATLARHRRKARAKFAATIKRIQGAT